MKKYNFYSQKYVDDSDLKEGQDFCDICDGVGVTPYIGPEHIQTMCPKCQGIGILDWVEKIVGKPAIMTGMYSSSGSSMGPFFAGMNGTSGISRVTNI